MGVYIKGMEMPKSCPCKLVGVGYDLYCSFTSGIPSRMREYRECCEKGTRPNWCPIGEVPPHGRLVDESWLKKAMITTLEVLKKNPKMDRQEMHLIAAFDTLRAMVEDAPTIIDAEGGK